MTLFEARPMIVAYGLLASLCAAGVWLQLASYFGWPVSTTHSIIGAVLGFGLIVGGVDAVNWSQICSIGASWVISPLLGGGLAFLVFSLLRRKIFYAVRPVAAAKKVVPYLTSTLLGAFTLIGASGRFEDKMIIALGLAVCVWFLVFFVTKLLLLWVHETEDSIKCESLSNPQAEVFIRKALKHLHRTEEVTSGELRYYVSLIVDELKSLITLSQRQQSVREANYKIVEGIFAKMQLISACFMAFAHGANDVANAIGPLVGVVHIVQTKSLALGLPTPSWILMLGGAGIIIGLATWGWRVIETVGRKITELTPSRGFSAEFGAALTILVASRLGLPISTTHTLVGAVLGVGLARGISALNLNTVRDILVSWIITIPAGACVAIVFYKIFEVIFGQV